MTQLNCGIFPYPASTRQDLQYLFPFDTLFSLTLVQPFAERQTGKGTDDYVTTELTPDNFLRTMPAGADVHNYL